jgi:putative molybdopterin biosynthesis protein
VDLGAVAGCGLDRVRVWRMPRVAIVPTGSELVPVGQVLQHGQLYEFNSLVLASQVREWGGAPTRFPIVSDELPSITRAIEQASAEHDLILVNAGSSAGLEDFTAAAVERLGEVLVHGVAVRPGHPVILGMIRRSTDREVQPGSTSPEPRIPVIGVPGYPVSAALTGEIFVEPLISLWLGRQSSAPPTLEAVSTRKVHSSAGDEEYVRVTVGRVGDRWIAAPLSRGAGVITSLVRADGLVIIPAGSQGIQAGENVTVRLYAPVSELARTILILGSHDLAIDLMAQHVATRGSRLTSANLGSLGGLLALQRREAHVAGSHLLDPESGEYNLAYVRRYLPGVPVVVVGLTLRDQGLIVPRGNPKGVRGLEDLARGDITFVNRQRGAGTRVLLDYHLDRIGIRADQIRGYDREEFTHLAICVAVASGRADAGLGIRAAADTMQMDFIPLFQERYDLVFPRQHYESRQLRPLLDVLNSPAFREDVLRLPGYDASPMGKVIAEIS